jgi:hypothetical protein
MHVMALHGIGRRRPIPARMTSTIPRIGQVVLCDDNDAQLFL